jgi:hypothetical protein
MAKKRNNLSESYNNYTKKESTNVFTKKPNKKEFKNILLDDDEIYRTAENKKPRAEANKIEKFLPDKQTIDFFNKIKKDYGQDYLNPLLKIQRERGNPSVNVGTDKGLPFHNRRNYNPFTNEVNIPKGLENSSNNLEDYLSEVAHAGQPLSKVVPRFLKNDIPGYIKAYTSKGNIDDNIKKYVYNNPNTIENYTHSVVQPKLIKDVEDYRLLDNEILSSVNEKADGGYINNELNPKYNNYLNMRQYAQGGDLTRFDEGGTHEASPLGGIPQGMSPNGKQNTVEQGESKKGNFIYSNRIALDKVLVKQFNLPNYVAGKSVSDASKAIDDKFKDRADRYAQETKKTLLDRLSSAQEYLKQQEQASMEQANQSMQSNSQEIPDQMNGQIPEGMEEYAEEAPQQGQDVQNMQTASPIAAFGGYQQNRYSGLDNPNSEMNVANPAAASTGLGGVSGSDIAGAVGGLYQAGQSAFGKSAIDTSGQAASGAKATLGGGAMKGFQSTAAIGLNPATLAATGGLSALLPVFTGVAGLLGAKKDQRAQAKNTQNFALNTNSQFSDQYAFGGDLTEPGKKIKNPDGSYSIVNTSTRQVTPGSAGTTIPGKPGSPAVLPSAGGVNATDPGRNKAFAQARASGLPTFNYNGKVYNTDIKLATPGRPAVNPTPAIVTPSIPPTYETQTSVEPIPNQVYNVQAQRGTAGTGVLRPGIGGGITTNNQYTANADVANRAVNAQQVYNADVNRRYAPVVDDGRSNNSAQIANRNAKAEIRRQQLQGTATATEIPTQLGLERRKVEALRSQNGFAYGGNMNQYFGGGVLPKPPTADYDTNIIQNLHDIIGIKSTDKGYGTAWGDKSNTALFNYDILNKDKQALNNQKNGSKKWLNTKEEFNNTSRYQGMKKKMGLTPEGYKFNPLPIEPINTEDPIITPTQTKEGFDNYANAKGEFDLKYDAKQREDNKFSNKAKKFIGENIGDAMRLAPVAMNAYQLSKLKKPQGFQYNTLNNRYVPQYVDEAQMQRIIDQEGNNQIAAISQLGGSEGATRNAILGIGANKMRGLSDAYANAAAQNRAQDSAAQQFNLGVDSQNAAIRNKAIDELRGDQGAYDSAKSKLISSIGTDVGEIGKEKNASDAAIAMFGYTRKGKYVVDKNGNKVSPETLAKRQADFATYISEQNKKANT